MVDAVIGTVAGDRENVRDGDGRAATTYEVLAERRLAFYVPDVGRGAFRDSSSVEG